MATYPTLTAVRQMIRRLGEIATDLVHTEIHSLPYMAHGPLRRANWRRDRVTGRRAHGGRGERAPAGGGAAELRWGSAAVCFPLGALACLLARDLWQPLDLP
jgi:hypothetical protein